MSSALTPLALVRLENLVRRARIDVVGAFEHPALHPDVFHQVVHRRDRLLIGRRAGVDHVLRRLLALVLHRIKEQTVVLLEYRQHGFARHGRPAAEDDGDLVLFEELARLFGEQRPVRRGIDHHRFELPAEQAAFPVLLIDKHHDRVLQRRFADRHRARQRMQDADLDRLLGERGTGDGQNGRERPEGEESLRTIHDRPP